MKKLGKLLLMGSMTLAAAGCGKKGALVYPDMLVPRAPASTAALQSGLVVKLQFELPTADQAGGRLKDLAGLKISRRELSDLSGTICAACLDDYHLFRQLYLDRLPEGVERQGERLVLLDRDVKAGKLYSYMVTPFNREGLDGASSPQVSARLVQAVLPPSLRLDAQPTEIRLSIASPYPPAAGSSLVGYNLYRSLQKQSFSHLPLNKTPLAVSEYSDSGLARGTVYRYSARAVLRLPSGGVVESLSSNVVEGMLKDDE